MLKRLLGLEKSNDGIDDKQQIDFKDESKCEWYADPKIKPKCEKKFKADKNIGVLIQLGDGRVVSGSEDGIIKIWHLGIERSVATLSGHSGGITCLLQLKDGRLLSGSKDKTIKLWDIFTRRCVNTFSIHSGTVNCLLQRNDLRVLSGSDDKTIKILDISRGQCIKTLVSASDTVDCLLELKNGRVLSGSGDGTIIMWDPELNYCLDIVSNNCSATELLQHPSGMLFSRGNFFNLTTLDHVDISFMHCPPDGCVGFEFALKDGRIVTSITDNDNEYRKESDFVEDTMYIWDIEDNLSLTKIRKESPDLMLALADGRVLANTNSEELFKIWDFGTRLRLRQIPQNNIASSMGHNQAEQKKSADSQIFSIINAAKQRISQIAKDSGSLYEWYCDTAVVPHCEKTFKGHERISDAIELSDGSILTAENKSIKILDTKKVKCSKLFTGNKYSVRKLLQLTATIIMGGCSDGGIRIWDIESKQCIKEFGGKHGKPYYDNGVCGITSLIQLNDGQIWSSAFDGDVRRWDIEHGLFSRIDRDSSGIHHLIKLPNDNVLSCGNQRRIDIFDNEGEILNAIYAPKNVNSIIYLHNGRVLISVNNALYLLDVENRKCINVIDAHEEMINALLQLNDGRVLSASSDGVLKIWDIEGAHCIASFNTHKVSSFLQLNNGRVISMSILDGNINLWDFGVRRKLRLVSSQPFTSSPSEFEGNEQKESQITKQVTNTSLQISKALNDKQIDKFVRKSNNGWHVDSKIEPHCVRKFEEFNRSPDLFLQFTDNQVLTYNNRLIRVWDINSGKCINSVYNNIGNIKYLMKLKDGRVLCATSAGAIQIWDIKRGICVKEFDGGVDTDIGLVQLSSSQIMVQANDGTVRAWDVELGCCTKTFHDPAVTAFASGRPPLPPDFIEMGIITAIFPESVGWWIPYKPAEGLFLRVFDWCKIGILDINKKKYIKELSEPYAILNVFPLDDGRILFRTVDSKLKIWNTENGQLQESGKDFENKIIKVSTMIKLNDGGFVTCAGDNTIKIWDVVNLTCTHILKGHNREVEYLLELKDGRLLSCCPRDKTMRLWDLETGECIQTITDRSLRFFTGFFQLDDGRVLVNKGTIDVWDFGSRPSLKNAPPKIPVVSIQEDQKDNVEELEVRKDPIAQKKPKLPAALPIKDNEQKFAPVDLTNISTISEVSHEIPYNKITFGEKLGEGSFGVVYKGMLGTKAKAIKKLLIKDPSQEAVSEFKKELIIMAKLQSDNIVQLDGYCIKPEYCLIMELMVNGSLYKLLHSDAELSWVIRYKIIDHIVRGIAYLHANNVIHRDLKSLNILLGKDYDTKIADFGVSKIKSETSASTTSVVGTVNWLAPEVIDGKGCSKASDMYGIGVIVWEIVTRKMPYKSANGNPLLIMKWISDGKRPQIPKDCPDKVAHLIQWCQKRDPSKRPSADEALNYVTKEQFVPTQRK